MSKKSSNFAPAFENDNYANESSLSQFAEAEFGNINLLMLKKGH